MYIRSPFNYIGGKFKILPQISVLLPEHVNTFVDLFCGGATVGVNARANRVHFNDREKPVMEVLKVMATQEPLLVVEQLEQVIQKYELSKTNPEGYLKIRQDYNDGNRSWDMFYAIIAHSFNNHIRFNKKGGFNIPFGKNRSTFNSKMKNNFIEFSERLHEMDCVFSSENFTDVNLSHLTSEDMVYCDPPYLITNAVYNLHNGGWNIQDEENLYRVLDELNEQGVKFALSNVLAIDDKRNDRLIEWSNKYTIHHLDYSYGHCNYQKKKSGVADEVLIVNY